MTWAVLGLVARGPRTGYDIKRHLDRTIRHFWAASYGQIYPELSGSRRRAGSTAATARGAVARAGSTGSRPPASESSARGSPAARPGWSSATSRCSASSSPTSFRASTHSVCSRRAGRATHRCWRTFAPRRRHRARSAVRRPRLPLGARLLRVGDRMVRAAGTPTAPGRVADRDLPDPTWRSILGRGLPQFAAEAVLPVLVFYSVWRVAGLGVGIAAGTAVSLALAAVLVRKGRDVTLVAIGAAVIVIQGIVGLASHSATVYLAQPVLLNALWGLACFVSIALAPAADRRARRSVVPVSGRFRASDAFRREFSLQSAVFGVFYVARAGLRLWALLAHGRRRLRRRLGGHRLAARACAHRLGCVARATRVQRPVTNSSSLAAARRAQAPARGSGTGRPARSAIAWTAPLISVYLPGAERERALEAAPRAGGRHAGDAGERSGRASRARRRAAAAQRLEREPVGEPRREPEHASRPTGRLRLDRDGAAHREAEQQRSLGADLRDRRPGVLDAPVELFHDLIR